jgi:Flp pilus assembly protein TadG
MKNIRHTAHRGQSMVEFALALPILIFLSVIIFDLGRAVYYSSAIHNAAREAVREGSVQIDVAHSWQNMKDRAIEYAVGVGLEDADITFAGWGDDEPNGNHTVQMTISYSFTPATPLVSSFLHGGVITIVGDAVMRTEYDKPNP